MASDRISILTVERYDNLNRKKEVSDRPNKLRFAYFATPGEDPATTFELITAYIHKHVPMALRSDRNGVAEA